MSTPTLADNVRAYAASLERLVALADAAHALDTYHGVRVNAIDAHVALALHGAARTLARIAPALERFEGRAR